MKTLCLGSLNLDYVYKVNHIVRPGETISCQGIEFFCGGKGLNQSIALARAGANVYHAGKVGTDANLLLQCLQDANVDTDTIIIDPSTPTGHAIIQVDEKGQNCIVIYGGANTCITKDETEEMLRPFHSGDLLLMQNETNNLEYAVQCAYNKNMKIALNPSPIDETLVTSPALALVDYFILNEIEGFELTGEKDGQAICLAMHKKYPGSTVVLTLGKQGCIYYDGTSFYTHGIYNVPVADTTAAGDTFTGYFLACMSEGLPIEEVLTLASKASSLTVSRAGASASIPMRNETNTSEIQLIF